MKRNDTKTGVLFKLTGLDSFSLAPVGFGRETLEMCFDGDVFEGTYSHLFDLFVEIRHLVVTRIFAKTWKFNIILFMIEAGGGLKTEYIYPWVLMK